MIFLECMKETNKGDNMEDQVKQITELFAAPRGELQYITTVSGAKIYTSTKLKQSYLKAMSKTSATAPIIKVIAKLMMQNELIPCYMTDKVYKSILKRQPSSLKYNLGLSIGKMVFIFVESQANIFSFASNNIISSVTVHELVHRSAYEFGNAFYQTFKEDYNKFYSFYWNKVFSLDINSVVKKDVEEIVSFLSLKLRKLSDFNNKNLSKYHGMLVNAFKDKTTLSEKEFLELVNQYIVLIKIFWKADELKAPELISKAAMAHKHLIKPFYTAYEVVFNLRPKKMDILCYQETYAPEEIISVIVTLKKPDPRVYKLINKL